MSLPGRPLPRALRLPTVVLAVLLLGAGAGALAACSSSSGATADEATAATDAVGRTFNLPADAVTCIHDGFAASGTAARATTATKELSSSQQAAVQQVLETCVTVDQWAGVVAGRISNAIPPADVTGLDAQVRCLTDAVKGLDETPRRSLLVGLVVVSTAPQTGELALERGAVLNDLYSACGVKATR